ncbi:TPA: hypothetical protein DCY43_03815 [candidate division WWE3 bacterium]|uniref:SWIM-type domain-containing protein n=2 Tax=Katanobacteria TaxID=422282 RepID=A0A1F4V7I8_UNCKA|nr:MAG: hypothetical protein A2709_02645 [candidate division WWE3 bacterium RIFCSPHIGHO2_01_FULL_43_9]HAZ29838.1 hypothetical protein [candidate division WWE3 bacterium]
MNPPDFTLDKIKFATDGPTFEKAIALYESGKVTQVEEGIRSYTAIVMGTKPYRVSVEARNFRYASCSCYLGKNDTYCKHMLALAICVVQDGKPLTVNDKKLVQNPACSGRLGTLSDSELLAIKETIAAALRYIKAYTGPSRTWFAYQNSLSEGCNRLSTVISDLPVGTQAVELLVDLLLRLDKKLCTGGVDDSDGVVGGFIEEVVGVLQEFAKLDPSCFNAFDKLKNRET